MYALCAFIVVILMNVGAVFAITPRAVTASSWQEPNRPQNTIDGRDDTRWSCQGRDETCWIKYDFGQVLYTSNMWLYWRNSDTRVQQFRIETSVDGATWKLSFNGHTDLPTEVDGTEDGHGHTIDDEIRYVRVTGMGNSFNDWNSLLEVEFIHPFDGFDEYTIIPWAVSVNASNVIDGNIPEYAEDADFSTFWTGGANDYIEWELDDVYPIIRVEIAWMNGHTRVQKYAIDVSIDGSEWTRVIEDSSTGATKDYESNVFPGPQMAKYVRIINNGGNNSRIPASRVKISITEVTIYASDPILVEEYRSGDSVAVR